MFAAGSGAVAAWVFSGSRERDAAISRRVKAEKEGERFRGPGDHLSSAPLGPQRQRQ